MIITVSISQFRQQIADYLAKAQSGDTVIVEDGKKGQEVAELVGKKKFNPESFGKTLKAATGVFTIKNHPEWNTKEDIIHWVEEGRTTADRKL